MIEPRNELEAEFFPEFEEIGEESVRLAMGCYPPDKGNTAYIWLQKKITERDNMLVAQAERALAISEKSAKSAMFSAFWTMIAALASLASVIISSCAKHI